MATPAALLESARLSPWAVTTRYDDVEEDLDRGEALVAADRAVEWARALLSSGEAEPS